MIKNKNKTGYSLIEILVAIGILLLLAGSGLVSYFNFRDRQRLVMARELVQEAVIKAQTLARSGEMRGCTQTNSYTVTFANSGGVGQISLRANCSHGLADPAETWTLPSNVVFSSGIGTIYVQSINGIIDNDSDFQTLMAAPYTIVLSGDYSSDMTFSISREGSVSRGTI